MGRACRAVALLAALALAWATGHAQDDALVEDDFLDFLEYLGSTFCADFYNKVVLLVADHFGERKIESVSDFRPSLHRDTKTRPACLAAVHGNDKQVFPAGFVDWVHIGTFKKDPILDRNGMQFTRTHANKR